MNQHYTNKIKHPNRIISYFQSEWWNLLIITITGIIYNIGMTASPWFEGQLAQRLYDILEGNKPFTTMVSLALSYVIVIFIVQAMRYAKRFYVRRFANNINRTMRHTLYNNLVHKSKKELNENNVGSLMTKAISDVEDCAEGMRKFTTEVFDTGVVMVAYLTMLFSYDFRLTLLSCIFPPFAYILAQLLKKKITLYASHYKKSAEALNNETLDRVSGTMTYRVLGVEQQRHQSYEQCLVDYEKKAVQSQLLETSLQPIYQVISMTSVLFIIWIGAKNIQGTGWASWDIAAFTTFLSCFAKLALKSSKAAKLFNAVQKAKVSWLRIQPLMCPPIPETQATTCPIHTLNIKNLSVAYSQDTPILQHINFTLHKGQIIGVSGPIACGKSTFGKVFLNECDYTGSIQFDNQELSTLSSNNLYSLVSYLGHESELLSDTIEENILLGTEQNASFYLRTVCMDEEVRTMPEGLQTKIGNGGVRLSGGQQARIALARTLAHQKALLILDDPFSALDKKTELQVYNNLKELTKDSIVILLSHRLYLFPEFDQILWLEGGKGQLGNHEELMANCPSYQEMYLKQKGDDTND